MTDKTMERKTFPAFITKTDEDQGVIEAFFAIFGNVDEGDDVLHPGAFTKTFTERGHKVKVLDNHRADSIMRIVGKPLVLAEVGRDQLPPEVLEKTPEAAGGAFAKIQMLMDTPEGRGVFSRLKNGAAEEWSFGYDALDYDFTSVDRNGKNVTVRNLRTVKLYEISPVIFAMNSATTTTSAKAQPSEAKPWDTFPVGKEFCVFRVDADGNRVGESLGCHDTEAAARQQVEALYAAEPEAAGKDAAPKQDDDGGPYLCECLECGHTMESEEHCRDVKCPECGGEMRRAERPGPGKGEEEEGDAKGVSGKTDWPLADRGRAWDNAAAQKRVRSWAGAEEGPNAKYRSCHFWYDAGNADNFTAYKLLFCDVVGGQVKAVPRGLFAVAGVLQGARGGAAIPADDQAKIKSRVAGYYARMRREFDDDSIVPPWDKAGDADHEGKENQEPNATDDKEREGVTVARHADTGELKLIWQDGEGKHHQITESEIKAVKEGRVLSTANANRIKAAVTSLLEALESAGIDIMEERGKAGPPPGDAPTSDEAGPQNEAAPTGEMLKLIEAERERISIAMEV